MFPTDILQSAERLIDALRAKGHKVATAESCTGGLLSASVTAIPGSSDVFEYGFVTYADAAKTALLGVPASLLAAHGAVSAEVAKAMAEGAASKAGADLAISVTGVAGPAGGSEAKPVGLVYMGCAMRSMPAQITRHDFGDLGRERIRIEAVRSALGLLLEVVR